MSENLEFIKGLNLIGKIPQPMIKWVLKEHLNYKYVSDNLIKEGIDINEN